MPAAVHLHWARRGWQPTACAVRRRQGRGRRGRRGQRGGEHLARLASKIQQVHQTSSKPPCWPQRGPPAQGATRLLVAASAPRAWWARVVEAWGQGQAGGCQA